MLCALRSWYLIKKEQGRPCYRMGQSTPSSYDHSSCSWLQPVYNRRLMIQFGVCMILFPTPPETSPNILRAPCEGYFRPSTLWTSSKLTVCCLKNVLLSSHTFGIVGEPHVDGDPYHMREQLCSKLHIGKKSMIGFHLFVWIVWRKDGLPGAFQLYDSINYNDHL